MPVLDGVGATREIGGGDEEHRAVLALLSAIFMKLGARDRAAAIVRAYQAGVVLPGER